VFEFLGFEAAQVHFAGLSILAHDDAGEIHHVAQVEAGCRERFGWKQPFGPELRQFRSERRSETART
jgi:hypothetical protein